jgi:ligand-binding sensor domain-containing protein
MKTDTPIADLENNKPKHKLRWLPVLIFFLVIAAVVIVDKSAQKKAKEFPSLPAGWQTIRPPHEVSAMVIHEDIVWAGGKDGVLGLDRKSGKIIKEIKSDPPFEYVRSLAVDKNGILWIGHEHGLSSYDGEKLITYTKNDGLPDDRVNAVYVDREGLLWVGTCFGAAVRQNNQWRVINKTSGLIDDMVNIIFQDKDAGMWFGSYVAPYGGISFLQNTKWQYFSTANGLPHNNITALFQDNSGAVWAGTGLLDRGGAAQLKPSPDGWKVSRVILKKDGLAADKARSIFQDRSGRFWFGSEYDGLAIFNNGSFKIIKEKDGLCNPEIKVILQDKDANIWLGTRDGVTKISSQTLP